MQAGAALALAGCGMRSSARSARLNVLFVAIDDLDDWVAPFGGYPGARTPHLDWLAERGVCFQRTDCAVPSCGGSRSSTLTGLSPVRTGWYEQENALRYSEPWFRERGFTLKTLPRAFAESGYRTLGGRKVFHAGFLAPRREARLAQVQALGTRHACPARAGGAGGGAGRQLPSSRKPARSLSHPCGALPRRCPRLPGRRELRGAALRSGSTARHRGDHELAPARTARGQPRGPHGALALHPLPGRRRGAV
jgi:hypothetical protein